MSPNRENGKSFKVTGNLGSRWICIKATLFVLLAVLSGGLLLFDQFNIRNIALLSVCIWSACRAYYFAFYVIEKYIDPKFRFHGVLAAIRYLLKQRA